jgi:excinuclease ABC subunit A
MDVLADAVARRIRADENPGSSVYELSSASGIDGIARLAIVDQKPIGRTPKSTPATYMGLWDHVRELFASLPESAIHGYRVGRFSFNSPEGMCLACEGQGRRLVDMQFLSDVWVTCESCGGRRFSNAALAVRFKDRNVADILEMTIVEAAEFFENQPRIRRSLRVLVDVGLGYLRLGQAGNTLSGGEAQRLKLAKELVDRPGRPFGPEETLYILDEPTTGLHFEDVGKLLGVLDRLIESGNSVIVIEHNLDVLAAADHIVELGPEAGDEGGRIVAVGTPEMIAAVVASPTGACLRDYGFRGDLYRQADSDADGVPVPDLSSLDADRDASRSPVASPAPEASGGDSSVVSVANSPDSRRKRRSSK